MHPIVLIVTIALFTTANLLTSYLYLYPIAKGCAFPAPPAYLEHGQLVPSQPAPFRLLALGDPQLEGSTSLLSAEYKYFPSLRRLFHDLQAGSSTGERLVAARTTLRDLFRIDIPIILQSWRKRLDLFGNDYYLAHIYRSLQWFTHPTHTTVLGDLLGSQWISDAEFESRGKRYWGRVLAGAHRVEDEITGNIHTTELGKDGGWARRVINVAGNHDIGYAGDMNQGKVERFDRVFGRSNWETRFTMPVSKTWDQAVPELRVVVLNSLNVDSPALDIDLQKRTFAFLDHVMQSARPVNDSSSATLLLTHLPLHKEAGVCVDAPYIKNYLHEYGGGIEEQNHLTPDSTAGLLHTIYGMGSDPEDSEAAASKDSRYGLILTGHDHEGCDVYHYRTAPTEDAEGESQWATEKWSASSPRIYADAQGIREITVRSMMGDFGGNAGLLSVWYDAGTSKWEFAYASCALGKQHLWWAVHVLDIITVLVCIVVGWKLVAESVQSKSHRGSKEKTL